MPVRPAAKFYWDSCLFIDWIQPEAEHLRERKRILGSIIEAARRDEVVIVTSAFTLAEVVRCNGDQPMTDDEEARINAFFLWERIQVRPVDRAISRSARLICRQSIIDRPKIVVADCIHIATALACGCNALQTFDEDHLISATEKFGTPRLKIELPAFIAPPPPETAEPPPKKKEDQSTLFDDSRESMGKAIEAEAAERQRLLSESMQDRSGDGEAHGDAAEPTREGESQSGESP